MFPLLLLPLLISKNSLWKPALLYTSPMRLRPDTQLGLTRPAHIMFYIRSPPSALLSSSSSTFWDEMSRPSPLSAPSLEQKVVRGRVLYNMVRMCRWPAMLLSPLLYTEKLAGSLENPPAQTRMRSTTHSASVQGLIAKSREQTGCHYLLQENIFHGWI